MKFSSELISLAWRTRRYAAKAIGCRVMEVSWKECLSIARESITSYKKDEHYAFKFNKTSINKSSWDRARNAILNTRDIINSINDDNDNFDFSKLL